MAELTDEIKEAIVTSLAQCNTQVDTIAMVKDVYGIVLSRQQVNNYNAAIPSFNAGARWAEIFAAKRAAFFAGIQANPFSHQQVRLEKLYRLANRAEEMGNIALAAQLIEQAAKEVGGIYSNVRHHAHSGTLQREPLSREDAIAELTMRLAAARERIAAEDARATSH